MLVDFSNRQIDRDGRDGGVVYSLDAGEVRIAWRGLFYYRGMAAGAPSIERLAREYRGGALRFDEMMGCFGLFICDGQTGRTTFFSDNSGMNYLMYCDRCASTMFLELLDRLGDFQPSAVGVVEFVRLSYNHEMRTLDERIRRSHPLSYYVADGGRLDELSKGLGGLDSPPHYADLIDLFRDFHIAIGSQTIESDLTGGYDSRMTVALLHSLGVPMRTFVEGSSRDAECSAQISAALNLPHDHTRSLQNVVVDADWLWRQLRATDGQTSLFARLSMDNKSALFRSNGIALSVSAPAGEMYKDTFWAQDFPFYRRKKANLARLYDTRMESLPFPHALLGEACRAQSLAFRQTRIDELQKYRAPLNTQTYDAIRLTMIQSYAGTSMQCFAADHILYAPIMEREAIKIGYQLPRRKRMAFLFQKRLITRYCPEISRLPTDKGTTASPAPLDVAHDTAVMAVTYARKAARVLRGRITGQVKRRPVKNDEIMRNREDVKIELYHQAVAALKAAGILAAGAADIPPRYRGHLLAVGLLLVKYGAPAAQ